MIWPHGEEKLSEFVNLLNSSHEIITFTHSPSKINFLDVTVLLHNSSIATDLHVKSTDTHQYLLSSSCHPNHIKKSIPYSLALRIRRTCSTDDNFKQRTNELLEFLCQRGHKRDYVKHKSTKLSMSHVKTYSTTNTRNPTTVQYLSLPTTQVYQILIISLKNITLSLRIAAKMPSRIHLFLPTLLPTAALATFAIPSYVLKLKHQSLHLLFHQK